MTTQKEARTGEVTVRPVLLDDLDQVDLVFRTAFGTFFDLPEPEKTFGDADLVRRVGWRTRKPPWPLSSRETS